MRSGGAVYDNSTVLVGTPYRGVRRGRFRALADGGGELLARHDLGCKRAVRVASVGRRDEQARGLCLGDPPSR